MLCTTISSALHNQMHSKFTRHSYISLHLIDTSSDDNLQQNEDTIHQYPSWTKVGHGNIRQSFQ